MSKQLEKLLEMAQDFTSDSVDTAKDYAPKIAKAAKEHLPSAGSMAKTKMKMDAKTAKALTKAMPESVKKVEIAKMILLPAAAAVTALLLAPKSGRELRSDIKNYFTDLKDQAVDKANEAAEWAEGPGMDKAHDLMDQGKDKAADLVSQGKEKASDLMDQGKEKASDLMDQGKEKADHLADQVKDQFSSSDSNSDETAADADSDPAAGVGNVHGTPYEPHESQTIPADKLDEALDDVGADSANEIVQDEKDRK